MATDEGLPVTRAVSASTEKLLKRHKEKHFTAGDVVRDVIIGVSDGLTVPFALAAGLSGANAASSLILTAGLAEVAAGAISMGLGGRVMERIEREEEELRRRRADEARTRTAHTNEVNLAVAMLDQERQHRHGGSHEGRAPNTDRKRHSRGKNILEDYFNPNPVYHVSDFRNIFRMAPQLFNKIMQDFCNYVHYFVQKKDAVGVLCLLPEQKLTAALRMLAYGASADQMDEIARAGKSTVLDALTRFCHAVETLYAANYLRSPTHADYHRLLQKGEARGFPGMIGSIDCMHWQWKNCPSAWQEDYQNRKGNRTTILEAVASFDTWVWHAFFGVTGAQNDINVLHQSPVFNQVLRGETNQITYIINNTVYEFSYYLADGIYPRWTTFVKTIQNPKTEKETYFSAKQEGYRKDVERCFGILQACWSIIRGASRFFDQELLRSIMMTCIILHNMIVEDEYDYDVEEEYEPDPMNTSLTRIYDPPKTRTGEPVQHDPLEREEYWANKMLERYTDMQDSYIHVRRQEDLIEHNWTLRNYHL